MHLTITLRFHYPTFFPHLIDKLKFLYFSIVEIYFDLIGDIYVRGHCFFTINTD